MLYFTFLSVFAKLCRTRIVFFGISLRKFDDKIPLQCFKLISFLSSYIGAREYASFYKFRKILPHSIPKIFLLPDPAMQIADHPEFHNQEILSKTGLDPERPYIAVCPRDFRLKTNFHNHHYSARFEESEIENYINSLVQITEWLVSSRGYQVVFVPMHVHSPDDDRAFAKEVFSCLSDELKSGNVFFIHDQYDPHAIISFLSHSKLVIGVRFHSLVLSFTCHTPVINIGYAEKNTAIMELFRLPDYSFSLNTITFNELKNAIISIEENEVLIKDSIEKRHLELKNIYQKELLHILSLIQ
jgi:polysaccharide pyruvyl transferase WcaK-like protein